MICGHFGKNIDLILFAGSLISRPVEQTLQESMDSGAAGDGHPGSFTGAE